MRYDINTSPPSGLAPTKVRVPPNTEITYISWRVEGALASSAVGWRGMAKANGIIDPMHVADEPNRVVVGSMLTAGSLLDIK